MLLYPHVSHICLHTWSMAASALGSHGVTSGVALVNSESKLDASVALYSKECRKGVSNEHNA